MKRVTYGLFLVCVALVLAAVFLLTPWVVERINYAAETGRARAAQEYLQDAGSLAEAFKYVATSVRPCVVNITSVKRVKAAGRRRFRDPWFEEHPFRDFFGEDWPDRFFGPPGGGQDFVQRGLGTGVIVRADGYILTNHHVVKDADEVQVRLSTGQLSPAEVVGADPKTDLAVIRVKADNLTPATLGVSEEVRVGEWVIAVGNPFGLDQTVTAGIVSAKGRANVGLVEYEDFIQTDAAINPGNSGGPLVNLRGEVVGVNTAIVSRSGGYQGIGFAVPIDLARVVMDKLIETGRVDRGWLGVVIQDLNEELAKSFGFQGTDGALISGVTPGGPAEKAGLKAGDVVLRFDGEPVKSVKELRHRVAGTSPGKTVEVEIWREGKTRTVEVKIELLDAEALAAARRGRPDELGLTVGPLPNDLARTLRREGEQGVLVRTVTPGSAAARQDIRPGDVILRVDGRAVGSAADFAAAVKRHDRSKGLRMHVRRGNWTRFVIIRTR